MGAGFAEALAAALERRFLETGHPKDLTLIFCAGIGDGKTRGLNRLTHPVLVGRIIGGIVIAQPAHPPNFTLVVDTWASQSDTFENG